MNIKSKTTQKKQSNFLFIYTAIILCSVFTLNCERVVDSLYPEKSDISLGLNFDREIKRKPQEYKILNQENVRSYVQEIVKQILKSPRVKRKSVYPYKVTILHNDKIVNAFCTPGGFIYVYTGLMKFLDSEAALAAVLAHEVAHAEKRHVRQRMLSSMGVWILVQVVLFAVIGDPGLFAQIGAKFAGDLALLTNSRKEEMEADEEGFHYLKSTPYYQGSMSFFFDKIKKEREGKVSRGQRSLEKLMSTHPLPEDRLRKNERRVKSLHAIPITPGNLMTGRYQEMLRELP